MKFRIFCNYEKLLRETIDSFNKVYKTDFFVQKYVKDEVNFAIIEYSKAKNSDIFDIGRIYGRKAEAYDKEYGNPRSSFID